MADIEKVAELSVEYSGLEFVASNKIPVPELLTKHGALVGTEGDQSLW